MDRQTGEKLATCTIITTAANEVLQPAHDRMPAILRPESYDEWLDPNERDCAQLQKLLMPYSAQEMTSHPISSQVNVPAADTSELIAPLNSL